jgi:branched-chain amino acid transport system permease protein
VVEALLAGLALGGVYALAAGGVIIGFKTSGILNFAYAAIAYFVARFYYFLIVQHGWPIVPAAVLSIVILGPSIGIVLWIGVFRFMRLASPLIKIVVTIGLAVAIPELALLLFGNPTIVGSPGLAPQPVQTFRFLGATLTMDQIITYGCAAVILGGGALVLRYTQAGLLVRATVDSEAMSSMSGVRPARVSIGVWAASTFMAGLTGVLIVPIIGLGLDSFTVIVAAAFAAVVAARLQSLPTAVIVGVLMGIVTQLVERYLPSSSLFTADVIPSIPFVFLFVFLIYFAIRGGSLRDTEFSGSALDASIAAHGGASQEAMASTGGILRKGGSGNLLFNRGNILPLGFLAVVAVLPLLLGGVWLGALGLGIAYGVAFLSYTVSAGEAGMIWLCMITFAGVGAFTTAELGTHEGWPVLAAAVVGGLICAVAGAVIGLLTIRLGDLYVALVTLTFGLLIENIVFTLPPLYNDSAGVPVPHPGGISTPRAFAWLALVVFILVALAILTIRRSTFGMSVRAVRWSQDAARTVGLSVFWNKIAISSFAAFIAGLGGGLLAIYAQVAIPSAYATILGLTWLAVVVTNGIRSISTALFSGLVFAFFPAIFAAYLPPTWSVIPGILFGLGATFIAQNPEGALAVNARQIGGMLRRIRGPRGRDTAAASHALAPAPGTDEQVAAPLRGGQQ